MTSIFRTVMGTDFDRLHPQLQRRFSVGLSTGEACTGQGVMHRIWHGGPWVKPFLTLGTTRNILVPRTGRNVPFTIENVPYVDTYGRETVTFVRTFDLPGRPRRFDAQMVLSPKGDRILDYLGTHQHLATNLRFSAEPDGSLLIRSGEHRFREGPVDVHVPELIGATAQVRESYDDRTARFRIQVQVVNRYFGPLFGYEGSFKATYTDIQRCGVRPGLRPVREESRA
ncbi:DUF4166 domain-containing protein [Streptomyces sp. DG2A-72]|uniref:DUF4166 domain-containing protein n=1 Tax=Streptomyces sp. DG2A-72 TaxID=3051386 RepID=UPI00265BC9F7|nr:DUF4166 domain-containing protein [Streptomyces sp. DG2A-72]MDO0936685.1 DUF4166 domain-containing protein [Streptomyces sp. DG2A-72]